MRILLSRLAILIVVVAVVGVAMLTLFAPRPLTVEVARISRGPLEVSVADEGKTRVKALYTVSAPIAGQMRRITLAPGDPVVAGETVLTAIEAQRPRFYDLREITERRALVASAKAKRDLAAANVDRAAAELRFAKSELARTDELVQKGATSDRSAESAELEVQVKQASLIVARNTLAARTAEVAVAEAALLQAPSEAAEADASEPPAGPILAPITGLVLERIKESATVVAPGDPLLRIGAPEQIEVVVDLLSEEAVQVREGAPARIDGWGGARTLNGQVQRIEPYGRLEVSALGIEEQRVDVIIALTDPPTDYARLGHGYRVDVAIRTWYGEDVLRVPVGALFRERNRWAVYSVDDAGRVALRHLRIGHLNEHFAEVLEGIDAGARVILHPSDRVTPGRPVLVQHSDEEQAL